MSVFRMSLESGESLGLWTTVEGAQRFAAARDARRGESEPTNWVQTDPGGLQEWTGYARGNRASERYLIEELGVSE